MKMVTNQPRIPAGAAAQPRRFTWNRLLWSLVYPQQRQRVRPTVSGILLVALAFGIGTAAYNAASNILFITLSLLLACLIASGVLAWWNFRGLSWELESASPMRVGLDTLVTLRVRNAKRFLPSYGLRFELVAHAIESSPLHRAETTFTARGAEVRAALARAGRAPARQALYLRSRLEPAGEAKLDWILQPTTRGRLGIQLQSVGSLFPFGFLRKERIIELSDEGIVWPAPVEYRRFGSASVRRSAHGGRVPRRGSGEDLFAVRPYQMGDSHRLIHWKASARTRQLLVRQFSAENAGGYSLWLETDSPSWTDAAQFELLVRFAATLAEDLFRAERLTRVALNAEPPVIVRRPQDLAGWLDLVAVVAAPGPDAPSTRPPFRFGSHLLPVGRRTPALASRSLITFAPDGAHGVAAHAAGQKIAAA